MEEADVDRHIEDMSRRYNTEREQLRQILKRSDQIERIESDLLTKMTFDLLIQHADIEDVKEETDGP